jgi:adenylate cyclase
MYIAAYVLASLIGLIVLNFLFDLNHLSGASRAPQILALTSIVLGITQIYGLDWAMGDLSDKVSDKKINFNHSWVHHSLRTMVPIFTAALVLIHFIITQSLLQTNRDMIPATAEDVIQQTSYIILFVIAWLTVTYLFHFLSERESALKIKLHFEKLTEAKYDYSTREEDSWGLWRSLIHHLNDFSRVFGERTKLLKSFSRFVTGEVAQYALTNEIEAVTGKEEELTVIMTDIRDFTRMSQTMKPDAIVSMLNNYFSVMLDEMVKHQIVVDKFIGDGILAYIENENNDQKFIQNQKSVTAALGMLAKLKTLNQTSGSDELRIGIGIHRGPLIKGYIGSRNKLQHTIIGDTVNRAARLESLCKELDVPLVITQEIWLDLEDHVKKDFKYFPKVNLKGVTDSVDVYGLIT